MVILWPPRHCWETWWQWSINTWMMRTRGTFRTSRRDHRKTRHSAASSDSLSDGTVVNKLVRTHHPEMKSKGQCNSWEIESTPALAKRRCPVTREAAVHLSPSAQLGPSWSQTILSKRTMSASWTAINLHSSTKSGSRVCRQDLLQIQCNNALHH